MTVVRFQSALGNCEVGSIFLPQTRHEQEGPRSGGTGNPRNVSFGPQATEVTRAPGLPCAVCDYEETVFWSSGTPSRISTPAPAGEVVTSREPFIRAARERMLLSPRPMDEADASMPVPLSATITKRRARSALSWTSTLLARE